MKRCSYFVQSPNNLWSWVLRREPGFIKWHAWLVKRGLSIWVINFFGVILCLLVSIFYANWMWVTFSFRIGGFFIKANFFIFFWFCVLGKCFLQLFIWWSGEKFIKNSSVSLHLKNCFLYFSFLYLRRKFGRIQWRNEKVVKFIKELVALKEITVF